MVAGYPQTAMVAGYPQTASYYSTAGSRVSSPPRYFCDGVEVSASQVSEPCPKQETVQVTVCVVACWQLLAQAHVKPHSLIFCVIAVLTA
jgi:hypothetical protein